SIRVVAIVGVEGEANLRDRRSVLEEQPARRIGVQVEVSRRQCGIVSIQIPEGIEPVAVARTQSRLELASANRSGTLRGPLPHATTRGRLDIHKFAPECGRPFTLE